MAEKVVAVVGATGAVGTDLLKTLEKRNFPVKDLKCLASKNSLGKKVFFKGEQLPVEELTDNSFKGIDIALFSAGSSRSKQFRQSVVDAGAVMVDNSSAFRMENGTPLVVPEINPKDAEGHHGVIANPNCSTIILLMAIYPLYKLSKIKRVIVSTYQAVSGAGAKALEELRNQTQEYLSNKPLTQTIFKHQIAFNLFSHDSNIQDNGYCEEENKMVNETKKILHDDGIQVTATTIRVPIFRSHTESIYVETEKALKIEDIQNAIQAFPGVELVDDRDKNYFPMPIEASEKDNVLVGRLRYDESNPNAINLIASGDQILKGAALNAVQIAELLV